LDRSEETCHVPVMVDEVKQFLVRDSIRLVIDMTTGTGGHSLEIMRSAPKDCRLIGLDLDREALEIAAGRLKEFGDRITLMKANFADAMDVIPEDLVGNADAILIDCGISRLEIVTSRRGFSFDREDVLDMRFDPSRGEAARTYLGRATVEEMTDMFRRYGELSHARRIAKSIAVRRERGQMETTADLAGAVKFAIRTRQARSLARVFLAVRAAVNRETENLTKAIEALPDLLASGGRACVISYHSVEDRVVKTLFNKHSGKCVCPPCSEVCSCGKRQVLRVLTRKPLVPTAGEVAGNPSARSAKLRVAEKM
jgi:16S rRNA (cytosine1402-N4)-methyltransferase